MSVDLSIIIVSWNVAALLRRCLASCYAQAAALNIEVIVIDNASADQSVQLVRDEFPTARLIVNSDNRGFPSAVNQGIAVSSGRYVMLLNPDAELAPDTAALLCDYLDTHPDVGVVGPHLAYPDGRTQSSRRRFPTLPVVLLESTPLQGLAIRLPAVRRYYDDALTDVPQEADWLMGACLVVRRVAIEQAGAMDAGFFMYSEEVDWCQRIRAAGWRIVYIPSTTVTHHESGSAAQDNGRRDINFNVSKVRYWAKWHGKPQARLLRSWLKLLYTGQMLVEAAKWLLGHKRNLRTARIIAYRQLLSNGLRRYLRPTAHPHLALLTAEYRPQPGGVGDYTHALANELGATIIVVGSKKPSPLHGEGLDEGRSSTDSNLARATIVKPRPAAGVGEGEPHPPYHAEVNTDNLQSAICNLQSLGWPMLRQVHHALLRQKVDTLDIQYQTGAYRMHPAVNLLPLYLKWRGNPARVVVTFHDLLFPYLFPKAGPLRKLANWLLLKFSDAAIVTNATDADATAKWGNKVSVIPIGSNIAPHPPADFDRAIWRQQHDLSDDDVLIAYFGLLNQSKGLDTLLHSLVLLPTHFKLAIIGGSPGDSDPTNRRYAQEIDALITQLRLAPRILRSGQLPEREVSAWLLSADLAALPFRDGASLRRGSLLAALAHSLPTVSTNTPHTNDIVGQATTHPYDNLPALHDGENLLLVPPDDPATLARTLTALATNHPLRQHLSAGAHTLAAQLRWPTIATQVYKVMKP